jgi:hypothetical protein
MLSIKRRHAEVAVHLLAAPASSADTVLISISNLKADRGLRCGCRLRPLIGCARL